MRNVDNKRSLTASALLAGLAFLLPWMSYNPRICGYLWGWQTIFYFAPAIILICFAFFSSGRSINMVLAFVGSLLNFPIIFMLWGRFDIITNVADHRSLSIRVLRPGFFAALILFTQLSVVLGWRIFKIKNRK